MHWGPDIFKYSPEELKNDILLFVLIPLYEAYIILSTEPQVVVYNENKITRALVWNLKKKTSLAEAYSRHSIDINLRPIETPDEDTDCEPDIKFTLPTHHWLYVEAKRIYEDRNWSIGEYIGDNGLGRFLSGTYYSIDDPYALMLCYVQNGDFKKIVEKIKTALLDLPCKKIEEVPLVKDCALSTHDRTKNEIGVYHLFFHFS